MFTSSERNYEYHPWRPCFIYFQTEVQNNQIKRAQKEPTAEEKQQKAIKLKKASERLAADSITLSE